MDGEDGCSCYKLSPGESYSLTTVCWLHVVLAALAKNMCYYGQPGVHIAIYGPKQLGRGNVTAHSMHFS